MAGQANNKRATKSKKKNYSRNFSVVDTPDMEVQKMIEEVLKRVKNREIREITKPQLCREAILEYCNRLLEEVAA